jgi:hypothetical protein
VAYLLQAYDCHRRGVSFTPVTLRSPLAASLLSVTLFSLGRLAFKRRWRAVLLSIALAVPTGIATGVFQGERCPHATYLQLFGRSVDVIGKGCNNSRDATTWWLRRE